MTISPLVQKAANEAVDLLGQTYPGSLYPLAHNKEFANEVASILAIIIQREVIGPLQHDNKCAVALFESMGEMQDFVCATHARKLERERDEARRKLDTYAALANKYETRYFDAATEREKVGLLRELCDKLVKSRHQTHNGNHEKEICPRCQAIAEWEKMKETI